MRVIHIGSLRWFEHVDRMTELGSLMSQLFLFEMQNWIFFFLNTPSCHIWHTRLTNIT